jgi:hypothetical protein
MCTQSHNLVTYKGTAKRRGGKRSHNTISEPVSDISTLLKRIGAFVIKV